MSTSSKPEVVVVTGSSGGVGRAIAHAFAKRGAHVGLLARGQEGLDDAAREVESFGGRGLAVPTDVADHRQVEAAAQQVEERFGDIDVWVNDAMATVFARFVDTEPEEFKRATEVTYLWRGLRDDGGAEADERAQPGIDRAGRVGTLLPGNPAAGRVLRLEVRHPRVHRLHPHRAAPRQEQGAHHDGPATRGQHHPVQLVPLQAGQAPDARAADLPAGDPRRGGLLGRPPPPPRALGGSGAVQAILDNKIAPSFADWYLARTGFDGQQIADMPIGPDRPDRPDRPDNLYEPVPGLAATHGMFDDQAKTHSPQL